MNIQEKARYLLEANRCNLAVEGGLFLATALQQVRLDYTPDSLTRIDALLRQMRDKVKPVMDGFLADAAKENFALTLGFYLGEYIARQVGMPIAWRDYNTLLLSLPFESAPPRAFNSHVAGLVGPAWVLPLIVLEDQLFAADGSLNAQNFVADTIQTIQAHTPTLWEWQPEHLDRFLSGQKIAGGVTLEQTIRKLPLDYSLDSLSRIDALLRAARPHFTDYAAFVSTLGTVNFAWLLASYVVRTTAKLASCSLRWLDYASALQHDPSLKRNFENSYLCVLGDRIFQPVQLINEQLFSDAPEGSCRAFAEMVLAMKFPKVVSLERNAVRVEKPSTGFLGTLSGEPQMLWKEQIRHAGMLAAHGAFMVIEGAPAPLTLFKPQPDGKPLFVDFSMYGDAQAATAQVQSVLADNPDNLPYQACLYEAYVNLPEKRLDAIIVDLVCYTRPNLRLSVAWPFSPATATTPFRVHTPKLINSTAHADLIPEIAIAFHEGIDSNKAFNWSQYADERW